MCCKQQIDKLKGDKNCFENKLTAEENKRKFIIKLKKNSKEEFCRIKVDNCLITTNKSEKCDFVFHRCKNEDKYYVELKGKQIKKAFNQIVVTIKQHVPSPREKNFGFIVASRVPLTGADIRKLKEDFKKNYGVRLTIRSRQIVHQV